MLPPKPLPKFNVGDRVRVVHPSARKFGHEFVITQELHECHVTWRGAYRSYWGYGLDMTAYRPAQGSLKLVERRYPEMI